MLEFRQRLAHAATADCIVMSLLPQTAFSLTFTLPLTEEREREREREKERATECSVFVRNGRLRTEKERIDLFDFQ